jgi:hypothetical protein
MNLKKYRRRNFDEDGLTNLLKPLALKVGIPV